MQSSNEAFFRVITDGQHSAQGWHFAAGYGDRYEIGLEGGTRADSVLRTGMAAGSK